LRPWVSTQQTLLLNFPLKINNLGFFVENDLIFCRKWPKFAKNRVKMDEKLENQAILVEKTSKMA